ISPADPAGGRGDRDARSPLRGASAPPRPPRRSATPPRAPPPPCPSASRSWPEAAHQARRGGTRLGGDNAAGKHAGYLFLALGGAELRNGGEGVARGLALGNSPMMRALGRDLRRMSHHEDLEFLAESVQPLAHRGGDRSANAAVDLIEDQRERRQGAGQ